MNSDAKSDIEEVRWVLIRRSALGILFMAILTLGSLRYANYRRHEKAKEKERLLKEAEAIKNSGLAPNGGSQGLDVPQIVAANS